MGREGAESCFAAEVLHCNALGVEFDADADLVAAGVEVLALDERRQVEADARAQHLLERQTQLRVVVHFTLEYSGGVVMA